MSTHHQEIDTATGAATTGHVWDDDLKELNKPLPRWWLYTFYVCCIWAAGYWVVYPAWPLMNGYTKGIWGYSQRASVTQQVEEGKAKQASKRDELVKTPIADVSKNAELFKFAMANGKAAFASNCAPCHGSGGQGAIGYPNLNDDDWLWGGKIDQIYTTIQHGIRADDKDTRRTDMPKFGVDKMLEPAQISDAAEYVLSLSKLSKDAAAAERGKKIFADNCTACHGEDGKGNQELGAPNLTDGIWLYGNRKEDVVQSISTGRGGVMPAWGARLDEATIRSLAVYVHAKSGGK